MRCPYCGEEKELPFFTKEHVIPRALGGNLEPSNPFTCRACKRCNNACGRYVDGRFIRSWLVHNAKSQSARRTYDFTNKPCFPLSFAGRCTHWNDPNGTVCDGWLGPTGDLIFHFHLRYDEDDDVFAGRPPHVREDEADKGTVFVLLRATNPAWHPVVIRSIGESFDDGTPIRYLNVRVPGRPAATLTEQQRAQKEWVKSRPRPDDMDWFDIAFDEDVGDRFLMKCALGIGTCILGEQFIESNRASVLRNALWQRDSEKRSELIQFKPFLSTPTQILATFALKDCHTILLVPTPEGLILYVILYGRIEGFVLMSDEPTLWSNIVPEGGLVWQIDPVLRKFVGEFPVYEYADGRMHETSQELREFMANLEGGVELSPFLLPVTCDED